MARHRLPMPHQIIRCIVLVAALGATSGAAAQPARITEPAAVTSRWQPEVDRLDQSYRDRVATATDGRAQWVAGQLDPGDPVAATGHFLRARSEAPAERLYLAALAVACLEPVQPRPPACDAPDRLADWATRDTDNGMPSLLLAERARQRNNINGMIAYLDEAAIRPRIDDYWNRGALVLWEDINGATPGADPAARTLLAAGYLTLRGSYGGSVWRTLCRDGGRGNEAARAACHAAGSAVADRGATWALRLAGARAAERNAGSPAEAEAAAARIRQLQQRAFACASQGDTLAAAFEVADAGTRERALKAWERRLQRQAADGEAAACGGEG
jgi:hypothetical protein